MNDELLRFLKEEADNSHTIFGPDLTTMPLAPFLHDHRPMKEAPTGNYIHGNARQRGEWLDYLNAEIQNAFACTRYPGVGDIKPYFEKPIVRTYFAEMKGMSGGEYDATVAAMTFEEFLELTKKERDYFAARYSALLDFRNSLEGVWASLDEYNALISHNDVGWKIGAVLAAVSFPLWWFFYQRHQDAILRTEAKNAREEAKKRSLAKVSAD